MVSRKKRSIMKASLCFRNASSVGLYYHDLYCLGKIRLIEFIIIMDWEVSTKIVNFKTPRQMFLCYGKAI